MENHYPNADNLISGSTADAASDSTPANMPTDGSITDSLVGNLQAQIQGEQAILTQSNPITHGTTDMVDASTQTVVAENEAEPGARINVENLNFDNMTPEEMEQVLQYMKNINVGLREEAFDLTITRFRYVAADSTSLGADCCSICLDNYCDGDYLGKIDCGHVYHIECIKEWIKTQNRCPLCQRAALVILPA